MIGGFAYVSVPVEDLAKAVRFYRDVLGLRPLFEVRERWAEFEVGTSRLAVYPREADERRGGEVAFLVDDLAAAIARLERRGVAFSHGVEAFDYPTTRGRLARFRDPSGNRLELLERR